RSVREKKCTVYEYSNVLMTLRLKAGAMGIPFLPARSFGGTDGFQHSGCKIVEDPFTRKPVLLAPALNPDVSIIHVHQADEFGNARASATASRIRSAHSHRSASLCRPRRSSIPPNFA